MSKAETTLKAMHKLGKKELPLTRIYRNLYNEELFLGAYNKLYRNDGSMTPGTTAETVDGMSVRKIESIIERLRNERFYFNPARRIPVPKADGRKRPISIPSFSDKLVQEVVRALLDAYYEPQFSDYSHGFRPNRGCHTALTQLYNKFGGTIWFVEGDIRGCFDNLDHKVLLSILSEKIHDGRIIELIRRMLKAGYIEDWRYKRTQSGAPQGGVISPLLSNIYLDKLDKYVENVLMPKYNFGEKRRHNKAYRHLTYRIRKAKREGQIKEARRYEAERRKLPRNDPYDPNYSRLRYVRYCDDFILGYAGPKKTAEVIKKEIGQFLHEELKLEMSQDKTLITHNQDRARFLGYNVSIYRTGKMAKVRSAAKGNHRRRSVMGRVRLEVPWDVRKKWMRRYTQKGKPRRESKLLHSSVPEIIDAYQGRFRGLVNYYQYATNLWRLSLVKYIMGQAMAALIAEKLKLTPAQVWKKYRGRVTVEGRSYLVLKVEVERKDHSIREIYWGGLPLKRKRPNNQPIQDDLEFYYYTLSRSDLVQRLLADKCELCDKAGDCEVHHVRRLSDLKKRWRNRKEKPKWVKHMIARQRKTLVVCIQCHKHITATSMKDQARAR